MQILENKRIILRALEPEDLDVLYAWENDPKIWATSYTLSPFSKYTLSKYIEQAHLDLYEAKQMRLVIQRKQDNAVLGAIDLFDFDSRNLRAGVGILIGRPEDRKQGYAAEALESLREYAFRILQLKQLYCNVGEDNQDSLNLFIRQGFVITGQKKDWIRRENGWLSEYFLQLVRI